MILPPPAVPMDEEPMERGRTANRNPERTMAKRLQYRRVLMLVVLVLIAFAGLGYRLVDLQVLRHGELSAKAIIQKFTPRIYQNEQGETVTNKYIKLKEKVSVDTWQNIQTAMTNLSLG